MSHATNSIIKKNVIFERIDINTCGDHLQNYLHRARYNFVLSLVKPDDKLLEIGTGLGVFSNELYRVCKEYIGIEYDLHACNETRNRKVSNIIQGDTRFLPLKDEEFSFIVCLEVLEHLGNYQAGIREIHRCMRHNGLAVISVPYRKDGGRSTYNQYHLYEPGEMELVGLLKTLFLKVHVYYQYFEETLSMTLARKLHLRRFLGLKQIYADLSKGLPYATSRLQIREKATGMKVGLLIVVNKKLR